MKKTAIAAALLLGAISAAQAAGDPAAGKTKSATCVACHGADGNSVNPLWPKLAGQHAEYITKQLMDFKAGDRKNSTMSPMAAPLSEQDVADLAAYFSSQQVAIGSADPEKAAPGRKIYQAGNPETGVAACMACHGPSGTGNPVAKFPRLTGQHADYVAKALKDFRSGTRANDPGSMMRSVAAKMSDAEIEAVAQYITGLH